jgi:hypothetical protein
MLIGPRINTDDVTPSCGLFYPAEEKICTVLYNTVVYNDHFFCVGHKNV